MKFEMIKRLCFTLHQIQFDGCNPVAVVSDHVKLSAAGGCHSALHAGRFYRVEVVELPLETVLARECVNGGIHVLLGSKKGPQVQKLLAEPE